MAANVPGVNAVFNLPRVTRPKISHGWTRLETFGGEPIEVARKLKQAPGNLGSAGNVHGFPGFPQPHRRHEMYFALVSSIVVRLILKSGSQCIRRHITCCSQASYGHRVAT